MSRAWSSCIVRPYAINDAVPHTHLDRTENVSPFGKQDSEIVSIHLPLPARGLQRSKRPTCFHNRLVFDSAVYDAVFHSFFDRPQRILHSTWQLSRIHL